MATRSKFYTFLGLLPEVQCADQLIPHRQKVIYTVISLLIFLAASQIPLFGVQLQPGTRADRLYWGNLVSASNDNTLLTLGIIPILGPEILKQLLVASKTMNLDSNSPEAHAVLNRMQKLMGILITICGAVLYVLRSVATDKFGAGNAALVAPQIIISGIIVIYLDDVLKKGYGLVSGISLLTDRQYLWKTPDLPGFQVNCLIKISKISSGSIISHHMLATSLHAISKLLYMNYGGNKLVNQLGTWKGSKQPIPDGVCWLRVCASSKRFRDGFFVLQCRRKKSCLQMLTRYLGTNS
ncbi:hypothetical protein QOZ80_2AG0134150 [Eleusine coracana subsp. coracana]|nr:hypothetical protein QOZ80_2AG0134150 [Eleusine coracana subsp. coracana]